MSSIHLGRRSVSLALISSLAFPAGNAWAQSYPTKPIRLVVGYPAGGGGDNMARVLAEQLSKQLGQPVLVDNRPGASGSISSTLVANSPADGYTLLIADRGMMVFNVGAYKRLSYNPAHDFAPIGTVLESTFVLVTKPGSGPQNIASLIDLSKKNPGTFNYAATSTASIVATELFKSRAGIDIVSIPYKGAAPALTDLLGGQVQTMMIDILTALPYIRAGKLSALAVTSSRRLPLLEQVPTLAESGLKDFEATTWLGLLAPAGTPAAIVNQLNSALRHACESREVIQRMRDGAFTPMLRSPLEMGQLIKEDLAIWPDRIRRWGFSVD